MRRQITFWANAEDRRLIDAIAKRLALPPGTAARIAVKRLAKRLRSQEQETISRQRVLMGVTQTAEGE